MIAQESKINGLSKQTMLTNDANGPDCWKCSLNVEWHDCSFCPVIQLRRGILQRSGTDTKPAAEPAILSNPNRRKNLFRPMRTNLFVSRRSRKPNAFTLVELLTVIAIIGILAAMLLPVLATVHKHALIMKAKTEMSDLVTDIQAYDQAYGRFPVSQLEQTTAAGGDNRGNYDFTYGGTFKNVTVGTQVPTGSGMVLNNSNVIAILMDITNFPLGGATVNVGHQYNPQMTKFLNAHMSGWNGQVIPAPLGPPPGGVDESLVYRDPWGNPYLITMDLNFDDQCQDSVYCLKGVSSTGVGSLTAGYYGVNSPGFTPGPGGSDNFMFHGKVMVWSAGPDGQVDKTGAVKANQGVNKDNLLSWQ